jgi:hypothetical protein
MRSGKNKPNPTGNRSILCSMTTQTDSPPSVTLEEIYTGTILLRFNDLERDPARSAQQADELEKRILAMYSVNPGIIFDYVVDASQVSSANFISAPARRLYMRAYKLPQTGRVAYVGLGRWLTLMTSIFTHLSSRTYPTQWFKTETEALAWLKQQQ